MQKLTLKIFDFSLMCSKIFSKPGKIFLTYVIEVFVIK